MTPNAARDANLRTAKQLANMRLVKGIGHRIVFRPNVLLLLGFPEDPHSMARLRRFKAPSATHHNRRGEPVVAKGLSMIEVESDVPACPHQDRHKLITKRHPWSLALWWVLMDYVIGGVASVTNHDNVPPFILGP